MEILQPSISEVLLPGRLFDQLVDRHGKDQKKTGDDQADLVLDAHQIESVLHGADDERAKQRRMNGAAPAEQADTADDRRRDRFEQECAAADAAAGEDADAQGARGADDAGERSDAARYGESRHLDARDIDARPTGGLVVVADGVQVEAEPGLPENVSADAQEHRKDEDDQGDP